MLHPCFDHSFTGYFSELRALIIGAFWDLCMLRLVDYMRYPQISQMFLRPSKYVICDSTSEEALANCCVTMPCNNEGWRRLLFLCKTRSAATHCCFVLYLHVFQLLPCRATWLLALHPMEHSHKNIRFACSCQNPQDLNIRTVQYLVFQHCVGYVVATFWKESSGWDGVRCPTESDLKSWLL